MHNNIKPNLYKTTNSISIYIYIAWFTATLFYCYQYILRIAPNVMSTELRSAFDLSADEFSTLGSLYNLFYSILQIPIGIIIDKIGIRKSILVSIIICITGVYGSMMATDMLTLQISRCLIGIGSAISFICPIKIVADHFSKKNKELLIGATLAFGTIGVLFSGNLMYDYMILNGWRNTFTALFILGIIMLVIGFFTIRIKEKNTDEKIRSKLESNNIHDKHVKQKHDTSITLQAKISHNETISPQHHDIKNRDNGNSDNSDNSDLIDNYDNNYYSQSIKKSKQSYKLCNIRLFSFFYSCIRSILSFFTANSNKYIIIYAVLAIGFYTPLASLADLWGSAFIARKFNLLAKEASNVSLQLYLGLGIGSIIIPWLCSKLNIAYITIKCCIIGIFILFVVILYANFIMNIQSLIFIMIMIGFLGGAEMMCFVLALNHANKTNSGKVLGIMNTLNMLGCAVIDQTIGSILDFRWSGHYEDNNIVKVATNVTNTALRYYSTEDFVVSLTPITIILIICITISFIKVRKT